MNVLDIIIIVPVVWLAFKGFTKGLIISLVTLAAIILGIWAGIRFSAEAGEFIGRFIHTEERYLTVIAFAMIVVITVVVSYLFGKLLEKIVDLVALGFVNKLLGAVFGIAKALVLMGFLLYFITYLDRNEKILTPRLKEQSVLYQPVVSVADWLIEVSGSR
jgi:membrane protein required for colicin V production